MTSTGEGLALHAVRRDLERARVLLSAQLRIERDRRQALARHLLWLLEVLVTDDAQGRAAMAELDRAARALFSSGDRGARGDALLAVSELNRLLGAHSEWVGPAAVAGLASQVHWLVDGLDARACEHLTRLLSPRAAPLHVKMRAEVYRYRKNLLWGGTPAYGAPARRMAVPAPR
ncbi:MAG TPA: hypothetical protein VGJ41_12635 [Nocardioides sp.]|jgi:hypothetical protein